ncbi:hypothetical protein GCM10020256_73500 [Streptomyces thermocoprophilus]
MISRSGGAVQPPGAGDALPLAAGQLHAAEDLPRQQGVEPGGQFLDGLAQRDGVDHVPHGPVVGGAGLAEGDVLPEPERPLGEVLRDQAGAFPHGAGVRLGEIDAVPGHAPLVGDEDAGEEPGQGGLAGAVGADEGEDLSPAQGERHPVDGGPFLAGVAVDGVLQADLLDGAVHAGGSAVRGAAGGLVEEVGHVAEVEAGVEDVAGAAHDLGERAERGLDGDDRGGGVRERDPSGGRQPVQRHPGADEEHTAARRGEERDPQGARGRGEGTGVGAQGQGAVPVQEIARHRVGADLVGELRAGGPPAHHPADVAVGDVREVDLAVHTGGEDGSHAGRDDGQQQAGQQQRVDQGQHAARGDEFDDGGHELLGVAHHDMGAQYAHLGGLLPVVEAVLVVGGRFHVAHRGDERRVGLRGQLGCDAPFPVGLQRPGRPREGRHDGHDDQRGQRGVQPLPHGSAGEQGPIASAVAASWPAAARLVVIRQAPRRTTAARSTAQDIRAIRASTDGMRPHRRRNDICAIGSTESCPV